MFSRIHPEVSAGAGLGLNLIQKHLDAIGGVITFESIEGQGTTFDVRFPLGGS